jgi:hypothetical protein
MLKRTRTPDGECKFSDAEVGEIVSKRDLLPNLDDLGLGTVGETA